MLVSVAIIGTGWAMAAQPTPPPSFVALLASPQASRWLGAKTFGGRVVIEAGGTFSATESQEGGILNRKSIIARDEVTLTLNLNQKSIDGQILRFRGPVQMQWDVDFSRRNETSCDGGFVKQHEFGRSRSGKTLARPAELTLDVGRGTYSLVIEAQEQLLAPFNVSASSFIPGDPKNSGFTGTPTPPPQFTRVLNTVTIRHQGADFLEWGPSYPLAAEATLDAAAMGIPSLDGRPFPLPPQGTTIRGRRTLPLKLELFDEVFSPNLTKTWTLTADPKPMRLEVEIPGHKEWMPSAGGPAGEEGNRLSLVATVLNADGTKSQVTPEKIEFRLINTSREPGAAINSPAENPRLDADLQFSPTQNPKGVTADEGQAITFDSATAGPSTTAVISSYDFGGYTTVEVKATLPGGQELTGRLNTGEPEILIPHRKPGSRIATAFQAPGADSDDQERVEGNPNEGDGLTQYEEYRGLYAMGTHRRLDSEAKEIVINDRTGRFRDSMALFARASSLKAIEVNNGELRERRLNFNSEEGLAFEQYGLVIQWGERMPNPAVIGVTVFRNGSEEANRWLANVLRIDMRRDDATAPDMLMDTAAHEMAHACGAEHHGEPFEGPSPFVLRPIDRLLNADGSPYANNPTELKSTIDIPGGLSSGDAECLMAYPKGSFVARPNSAGGWNFTRALEPQVRRTRLCRSQAATGYNTLPHSCGDASAGNCFAMIRLRS